VRSFLGFSDFEEAKLFSIVSPGPLLSGDFLSDTSCDAD
jgi:hypothetical protein